MNELLLDVGLALWLGILMSISPCPLATNVAAMSFIGKRVTEPRYVLLSGLLYTFGRAIAYLGLASALVAGLTSAPGVSMFLQRYLNRLLGPLLVLVGMFLLDLLWLDLSTSVVGEGVQKRAEKGGLLWALLLGILFALSLCPVSAALFFGGLLPLAIKHGSMVLLPALFGVGTGIPVIVFAFVLATSVGSVSKVYDKMKQVEWWARRVTGAIFVIAGIYLSLIYIYGVL